MKKVIALLSIVAFLAVNVSAQTTTAPAEKKTETSVKEPASHSCCAKPNAACCKNNKDAKSCTAEQKASCEKASKSCSPTEAKKDDKK